MVTLKDCDIVICNSNRPGRCVIYYVVICDNMVSFGDGRQYGGSRKVGSELPTDCVRVYRPKHISNTFNGSFVDEKLYDCLYAKDHPSLVKTNV